MEHPNLIPVVLGRAPLGIGTAMLESSASLLEEQGVPSDLILPLIETLEMLSIASAMYSRRSDSMGGAELSYHEHPTLLRALARRDGAEEQLFEDACGSVIAAVQERIATGQRTSTARTQRRKPAAKKAIASAS